MTKTYFNPGCALSVYKPHMEQRILHSLNERLGPVAMHNICCDNDPSVEKGAVIINTCAGCDKMFSKIDGISTVTLWEAVDGIAGFPFPDYGGVSMSVQDACPVRGKPRVHKAVRSLLEKMNINVIETELHGGQSVCCGDDVYSKLPPARVRERMKARADAMPCENVAVYCVSCVKAMSIGGKKPRHMADLLFGEPTDPGSQDLDAWHGSVNAYAESH
jgi:Fe-S oxidoreductase